MLVSSSVYDILMKDLKRFLYKIHITQSFNITDQVERLAFCRLAVDVASNYAGTYCDIWFTDKSHFLISGHVCKQHMKFFAIEQPHCFTERPLHTEK